MAALLEQRLGSTCDAAWVAVKLLKITFIRAKRAFTLLELHRIQSCDPITV